MTRQRRHLLRDIFDLQDRMNRVFEESLRDTGLSRMPGHCNPPIDVFEDDDALYIRAELPGVRREDIVLDFSEGVVTISGKKPYTHDNQNESYHMIERQYGSFRRSLSVSHLVDSKAVRARMEAGVLEIVLPKLHDGRVRRVPIIEK
ncbi:MAG TPA: Hsp20/alpha crystallin family protein [Deltaproteobacteria bacterium]|nr:Hsp20/alpha crystallin family protein [Deltaproteobacteria bacterium]